MSTHSLYPAYTPTHVWVAQEVSTGWWLVKTWTSGPALLMSACPNRLAAQVQKHMDGQGHPARLWPDFWTLRRLGWQDACQLAASIADPSGRPGVPTLVTDPERKPAW